MRGRHGRLIAGYKATETLQRRLQVATRLEPSQYGCDILGLLAEQSDLDFLAVKDIERHGLQDFTQRGAGNPRARRCMDKHHRLADGGFAGHQPVERILEAARYAVSVFRLKIGSRPRPS